MDPYVAANLKLGPVSWNEWRHKKPEIKIDLSNHNFEGFNFDEYNLEDANFIGSNLQRASFGFSGINRAVFRNANLSSVKFRQVALLSADFQEANLEGVNFMMANLERANFSGSNCQGAKFISSNLLESNFTLANCRHASFNLSILGNGQFGETDLRFACLQAADLTQTKFMKCKMGPTNLHRISFSGSNGEHHQPLHDFTETIQCDHWLTWGRLRWIGKLPLFSVSYSTLGFGLTYVNCVEAINRSKVVTFLNYPIGVPHRISMILFASVMLAIGATLYAYRCPKRIQQFDETQWVEEFGHSRLQYFADSWSDRPWLYPTFAFTVIGGVVSVWLFLEFLWYAMKYLLFSIG